MNRRAMLRGAGAALLGAAAVPLLPGDAAAVTTRILTGPRRLKLHNLHTGERLDVTYHDGERYLEGPLFELEHHLRDWRTDEWHKIDRRLINVIAKLHEMLGADAPFDVISGYRSPQTNARLHARSPGVARRSYHTMGKAVDITLPGRSLTELHRAARSLKAGGVGLYSRSGFVHVDVGPVRYWGR